MKREITKKHIFNYEMKYRNIIETHATNYPRVCPKVTELTTIDVNAFVYSIEYILPQELVLSFFDDFKEAIDWMTFTDNLAMYKFIKDDIESFFKVIDIAKIYLYQYDWETIIEFIARFHENHYEEFFRRYKDDICWDNFRYDNFDFSLDFIKEMKEYINFDILINERASSELQEQISLYFSKHRDEVLYYEEK